MGLVGESGCRKATVGRCVAGLMQQAPGRVYFGMDSDSVNRLDEQRALPHEKRDDCAAMDHRYGIDMLDKAAYRNYRRNCRSCSRTRSRR